MEKLKRPSNKTNKVLSISILTCNLLVAINTSEMLLFFYFVCLFNACCLLQDNNNK